jgi:hypothetical protein
VGERGVGGFTLRLIITLLYKEHQKFILFMVFFIDRICPKINTSGRMAMEEGGAKPVSKKPRVKCEECGQSFRDKYVLKKHVNTQLHRFDSYVMLFYHLNGSKSRRKAILIRLLSTRH